jgi:hypothetical protein
MCYNYDEEHNMKKSELRRLINELQLQVEQLNIRLSDLEGREQAYPPRVYRSDNPLYPGPYGWKVTSTKR